MTDQFSAYPDRDIFELQSALNAAAQAQTAALNSVQQRTDKVVSGNIDYFKELSKLTDTYLAPYRELAKQGAGFYLDAIGVNGTARQQAILPQANNIFNQQGINSTPFLQSIPGWSMNNAQYQASNVMNTMFGDYEEPAQSWQQQEISRNQQALYQAQERLAQAQRNSNISNNEGLRASAVASIPKLEAEVAKYNKTIGELSRGLPAQAPQQQQQMGLPGQPALNTLGDQANPFYQGGVQQYSAQSQRNQQIAALEQQLKDNEAAKLKNRTDLQTKYDKGMELQGLERRLAGLQAYLNSPNGMGPQGIADTKAQIAELTKQIEATRSLGFDAKGFQDNRVFNNLGLVDNNLADVKFNETAAGINSQLEALRNARDPLPAQQQALTLNTQAPKAAPNKQLMDFTNRFKNTSIGSLMNEANAATSQAMAPELARSDRFLNLMEKELNTDRSNFANEELNRLLDPATGAVNNWINSDLVKQVMGTTIESGTNAVQNAAAARGMLNSGQTLAELQKVGTNAAGQYIVPMAGQLANNVLSQGAQLANSRMNNYYNLLGQGAQYAMGTQSRKDATTNSLVGTGAGLAGQGLQFANNIMNTQANMTSGLQNNYGNYANNYLQNLMAQSNQSANTQAAMQVGGLANLLQSGQNAVNNTANMYANLGTNVAGQNIYGNDVYANAEMSKAAIEANRLQQMAKLNNLERMYAQQDSGMQWGNIGGLALSLGAMALGGGL